MKRVLVSIIILLMVGISLARFMRVTKYTKDLRDSSGKAFTGDYWVELKYYDSPDSDTPIWVDRWDGEKGHPKIHLKDGKFDDTFMMTYFPDTYLEIYIDHELVVPREKLVKERITEDNLPPDLPMSELLRTMDSEDDLAVGLTMGKVGEDSYISGDRVGIGTNAPSVKLEVDGNIKANSFLGDGSSITNIRLNHLDAADESPANVVWVDNDGNVGMGTTSPNVRLEVNGGVKPGWTTTCNANTEGTLRYNTTDDAIQYCNGSSWGDVGFNDKSNIYRWISWSTYNYHHGQWYAGNNRDVFGYVYPSDWGNGNARAWNLSGDKHYLRSFFTRKGYAGSNAMVYAEEWRRYSSDNSKHVGVLWRIKSTNASTTTWNAYTYHTSYPGWSERASVCINGSSVWEGSSSYNSSADFHIQLSVPANRTSTAIFISASSPESNDTRSCFLAFWNNCLNLPNGLEFVDNLASATGSWGY